MKVRKNRLIRDKKPTIAPGMGNDQLRENATEEEIKEGDYTEVTTLSYDEVDPS